MYYVLDHKKAQIDRNMNIININLEITKLVFAALETKFFNLLYSHLIEKVNFTEKYCFSYNDKEILFVNEDYVYKNGLDFTSKISLLKL